MRKHPLQVRNWSKDDFHSIFVKPFNHALIEEVKNTVDISIPPTLNAFLRLDPQSLPDRNSSWFASNSKVDLKVFLDFWELVNKIYSKEKWWKMTDLMKPNFNLSYWNLDILKVISLNKNSFAPEVGWQRKCFIVKIWVSKCSEI